MKNRETKTLVILHTAVFLAGWTGILGRMISLGGLPLGWYRMMFSGPVRAGGLAGGVGGSRWCGTA